MAVGGRRGGGAPPARVVVATIGPDPERGSSVGEAREGGDGTSETEGGDARWMGGVIAR